MGERQVVVFGNLELGGGKGRCVVNLIPVWESWGVKVHQVGYRDAACHGPEEFSSSCRFQHLGTKARLPTLFRLWRYLRRFRPDVILARNHLDNLLIILAGRLPGVKTRVVVEARNNYVASTHRGERKRRKKLAQVRRHYPRANALVGASEGVVQDLVRVGELDDLPTYAIPNPILTKNVFAQAEEAVDHPWLNDREAPVLISVARLAEQKDLGVLLEALAMVRARQEARLIVLGEGPLRGALERRVQELGLSGVVDMPGHVANPYAFLAKADLFVLSSAWEGSPNALIEALALGLPVVSTDCPSGPAEILDGGRYGRLVPVGDSDALAEAIGQTLDQPLEYDPIEATRRFTPEDAAPRYLQVLFGDAEGGKIQ